MRTPPPEKTVRAAVYCRISQDKEGKRLGVERQEQDCRALVERNGWTLTDVYTDNDITAARKPGGGEKVRPEYDRLVAAIKAGQVDALVAYSQSRLTRKGTIEDVIDLCEANHVDHVAIVTGSDINPTGNLVTARVQAAVDAEYVRKLSEDGKRAKKQAAEAGRRNGGRRCYGYTTGDVPEIIPQEAERIRAWADAIINGTANPSSIAADLRSGGVPTSTETGTWKQQTVSGILTNRQLVGRVTLRGEDHGPALWEPILDAETFAAVGALLNQPERAPKRTGAKYPLIGVLKCGHCGRRLSALPTNKNGRSIRRYGCRNGHGTIVADATERTLFDAVARLADLPRVGQIIRDAEGHEDAEAAALRVANAEDSATAEDIAEMVKDRLLSVDEARASLTTLREAIAGREAKLASLAGRSALDRFAGRVTTEWDTMTPEDQRAVYFAVVTSVRVAPAGTVGGLGRLVPMWRFAVLADIDWPEPTAEDLAEHLAAQTAS